MGWSLLVKGKLYLTDVMINDKSVVDIINELNSEDNSRKVIRGLDNARAQIPTAMKPNDLARIRTYFAVRLSQHFRSVAC